MIKAIFFDIDNTLLDFDAYVQEAMKSGFEKFQIGTYEDWMFQVFLNINNKMWGEIENGNLTFEELLKTRWNNIFAALDISFDGCKFEDYFKSCLFESAIPVEGAVEALEYLKGKYVLCTASNGPHEQQVNRLHKGGMLHYFKHVFTSGKVGVSKPANEFFEICIDELNVEQKIFPSEILMIGDSLSSDMEGGINSGLKTCFYDRNSWGNTKGLKVDYIINSLNEIRTLL